MKKAFIDELIAQCERIEEKLNDANIKDEGFRMELIDRYGMLKQARSANIAGCEEEDQESGYPQSVFGRD